MNFLTRVRVLHVLVLGVAAPGPLMGQDSCPGAASADAEAGWASYRAGDIPEARAHFEQALSRCAGAQYARTGLGYVELRDGRTAVADSLFTVVLAAEPSDRPEIRESQVDPADTAWRAGDIERARELYEARLRDDPTDGAALHRMALMRAWSEDYAGAHDLLERLIEVEPLNVDARVDRARILAWQDRTDQALTELADVLAEHPDHAGALEARALFQEWSGRYQESLTTYDQLLAISPENDGVRRRRARLLSLTSDFEASGSAYERLLAADPDDIEARLGLARSYALSDDLESAIAEYDRVLAADPEHLVALQGKGRTLAWADRLIEGEDVLRRAVALDRTGADSHTALAQILQWQGRNVAAKTLLDIAVSRAPTNGDAREQLRTVNRALAPTARPAAVYESDSDGNRMVTTSLSAGWRLLPRLEMRFEGYRRDLEQGALQREAFGGLVTGVVELEPGWTVTIGAGGRRSDAVDGRTRASWRGGVRSPGRHDASAAFDVSSEVLDETAALAERGIRYTSFAGNLRWTPSAAWRLDGSGGYALFEGSADNSRASGALALSRRIGRSFSLTASTRLFSYAEDLNDGYFDPDFYGIVELVGSVRHAPTPWSFVLEAAPGVQKVTREGDRTATVRGSARTGYLIAPGRELSLSLGYSSAGLTSFSTGSSDYSYKAIILGLNWVF